MLQENLQVGTTDATCVPTNYESGELHSILATDTHLPPAVVSAEHYRVFDRTLTCEVFDAIVDPTTCLQEDASKRCQKRREALAPYFGARLVCVLIALPGVTYTIEIDPLCDKVVYWEYAKQ